MLEIRHLSYQVSDESGEELGILNDVSLTIGEHKFVVITGPNGGGKTTLAKAIMGLVTPTGGQILWNGEDITSLNITERAREIATLKVLGFTPREVNAYIFREIVLLAMLGALVGLGLGVVLEGFVVVTAEVDQVMFGRTIHWDSFVIAFVLTMVFTAVVMLVMRPKLARIDMVESLKSNE